MSSSLCRVAIPTVTPPTTTGSRTAYGLSIPVRPTLTLISLSTVCAVDERTCVRWPNAVHARHCPTDSAGENHLPSQLCRQCHNRVPRVSSPTHDRERQPRLSSLQFARPDSRGSPAH